MEERNSDYKIESSRSGQSVPVIDGIYLHSVYNPTKEAEAFAIQHLDKMQAKPYVLILGLGFGYHIEEVAKKLKAIHGENYSIFVLEPNKELARSFNEKQGFKAQNITIINSNDVNDIFGQWEFVSFLMQRPLIIKHDASFTLEKKFYSNFLSYNAPKRVSKMAKLLSPASRALLQSHCDTEDEVISILDNSQNYKAFNGQEKYLIRALHQIQKSN